MIQSWIITISGLKNILFLMSLRNSNLFISRGHLLIDGITNDLMHFIINRSRSNIILILFSDLLTIKPFRSTQYLSRCIKH